MMTKTIVEPTHYKIKFTSTKHYLWDVAVPGKTALEAINYLLKWLIGKEAVLKEIHKIRKVPHALRVVKVTEKGEQK